jgi:hypothetical protein
MLRTAPLFLALLTAACASLPRSTPQPVPAEWMSVPQATRIGSVSLRADGTVTPHIERTPSRINDGPVRAMGSALLNGDRILAENVTVESLDLSELRGEVAFSAMHDTSYDIALISTDGGAIHWMPNDPADEVAVQWAPRGNKISYVIRAPGGDIVRTLHIPTSYQYAVPFGNATIHALSWEPAAERFAVAYSTPETSDRVEVLKYSGEERRTVIAPSRILDVEVMPLASGAIVLRPREIRYDEKLPLVVWVADDFAWSDARAALMTNARVAVVVTKKQPDAALWRAAEAMPWIDAKRAFIVAPTMLAPIGNAVLITGDASLPAGHYERRGDIVAVAPAVVQSFAAGFIAGELKRDPATNVSSR